MVASSALWRAGWAIGALLVAFPAHAELRITVDPVGECDSAYIRWTGQGVRPYHISVLDGDDPTKQYEVLDNNWYLDYDFWWPIEYPYGSSVIIRVVDSAGDSGISDRMVVGESSFTYVPSGCEVYKYINNGQSRLLPGRSGGGGGGSSFDTTTLGGYASSAASAATAASAAITSLGGAFRTTTGSFGTATAGGSSSSSTSKALGAGIIAAIVVSVLVGLGILGAIIGFCCCMRRRKNKQKQTYPPVEQTGGYMTPGPGGYVSPPPGGQTPQQMYVGPNGQQYVYTPSNGNTQSMYTTMSDNHTGPRSLNPTSTGTGTHDESSGYLTTQRGTADGSSAGVSLLQHQSTGQGSSSGYDVMPPTSSGVQHVFQPGPQYETYNYSYEPAGPQPATKP